MANDKKKRTRVRRPERRITVRGVMRDEADLWKLGHAALAAAQAEADARAEAEARLAASRTSDSVNATQDGDVPKEAA